MGGPDDDQLERGREGFDEDPGVAARRRQRECGGLSGGKQAFCFRDEIGVERTQVASLLFRGKQSLRGLLRNLREEAP